MDNAAWRITVTIPDGHAGAVRDHLEQTPGLDLGSNDDHVYVYAPTRDDVERAVPTVRAALDALGLEPAGVAVDQWLEDETRWSSEPKDAEPDDDDASWLSTILEGLTRGSPI